MGRRRSAVAQGRGVLGEARLAAPKECSQEREDWTNQRRQQPRSWGPRARPSGPESGKSPAQVPQVAPEVTRGLISSHFPTPIPAETRVDD